MPVRRRARIEGIVQGVGFRPFVARLATEMGLGGLVRNEGPAVVIEVEGEATTLDRFAPRLLAEVPPAARIDRLSWEEMEPSAALASPTPGQGRFQVLASAAGGAPRLAVPPDLRVCDACLAEVDDPAARRHGYAFTNCTRCGPRFTILDALPYDRARTSMAGFPLCPDCAAEHRDPNDRRYHAEPIACPACGPRPRATDAQGRLLAAGGEAIAAAAVALRRGEIVALKGVGGYQLLVDARDDAAVRRLRARKHREEKPLAVMYQSLDALRADARLSPPEEEALRSPAGPIVLVERRGGASAVAPSVAPGNPRLGAMLPTTPLHHLLLTRFGGGPLVATSGNASQEPIAAEDGDARARLGAIADLFLSHDRPIVRRCDDAVVYLLLGRVRALRLGRGLAPAAVALAPPPLGGAGDGAPVVLCAGGHKKNAPAALANGEAALWPHVGDLDAPLAREAFEQACADLLRFLRLSPAAVAVDPHPDYASTVWAEETGLPLITVQHHHAHVAACLAEHGVEEALGVAFDGIGLGGDGLAWGGEFLRVSPRGFRRVAHLRAFPLPGGDAAARDGRRALAGALVEAGLPAPGGRGDIAAFADLCRSPRLSPRTTSAGRLFDAVAALTGVRERSAFEGQAAMMLEFAAAPGAEPYPFTLAGAEVDWRPALAAMVASREEPGVVASRFHATLAAMIAKVAERERAPVVALGGGCFQNRLLAESVVERLTRAGRRVLLPAIVPPGDGGLALGQAWVARASCP